MTPHTASGRIAIDGAEIALTDRGDGPPLLLLHGYPETRRAWRRTIDALAPRFRCYAPDIRGWGDSSRTPPYTLAQMVDDTLAVMDALGHERYHLVGHDWGAAIADRIGRLHPDRLLSLVTVSMPVVRFDWTKPLHFWFFLLPLLPEAVMGAAPAAFTERILRWWAADPSALEQGGALAAYREAYARPGTTGATLGYYRSTIKLMLRRRLGARGAGTSPRPARWPTVPWHVIWGAEDPVSPAINARLLCDRVPGLTATVIPGAGHFPHEERPAEFSAALEAFLTGVE